MTLRRMAHGLTARLWVDFRDQAAERRGAHPTGWLNLSPM
jgi:hypothetical protein